MFKSIIQRKLERCVKKYFARHPEVKLVIVTGSVGKTATKIAIGTILSQRFRVRMNEGNHNAELSAPLAMLGIDYPTNIRSIKQWLQVFKAAKLRINEPTDVDIIVQEVGSDKIGSVPHFGTVAQPNIAVVTAVSPEHMKVFGNLDNVAAEELSAANFSQFALINRDDIDGKYAADLTNAQIDTYGTSGTAEYHFLEEDFSIETGYKGTFVGPDIPNPISGQFLVLGDHGIRSVVAAVAVATKFGMTPEYIVNGLKQIHPVAGRMNLLKGLEGSLIIDDTYNASPLSVAAAISSLYQISAPQKIAVLGSMNELAELSAAEHQAVGKLCDPTQLAYVVTVGEEAEKYLADAARERGCQVRSFKTALEAGAFVHQVMEPGSVILFKGSQDGIYLEEAVKIVLHETEEESQLVRQSASWIQIKDNFFSKFS